jgi:hypothetical protein
LTAGESASEETVVHTRILRCMLATDDSYAYWQNVDPSVPIAERARVAFERRWFGHKSEARVTLLMSNLVARFDAYPEALALLHRLTSVPAALRPWICHFHTQLSDPLYRRFTGEYLPSRRAQGTWRVDRDTVAAWVDSLVPARWSPTTCRKFASNLLATAADAGVLKGRKDPRDLSIGAVPEVAIGYALYLLRGVRIDAALGHDPYLSSIGLQRDSLPLALHRVPGLAYRALGDVAEIEWGFPSLSAWGLDVLGATA